MGKVTGFIEWQRILPSRRAITERVRDWREVDADTDPDELRRQSGRCMDCGVPFCQHGCPLGNPIPEFNDLVWQGRWQDAYRRLAATNDLPEMTGRLCPAPCEASCVLSIDKAPVTIESIEKAISERAFAEGWVTPQPPRTRTGKTVAIVGSGPAGLAAAAQLNRSGHRVVVFEQASRPGGLLRYGIPDFKLDKHVVDRRIALLEAEGIEFRCNAQVGRDPTWTELRTDYDAVVLAIGAMRPRDLTVPGRDLDGVILAMDYLVDQNVVNQGSHLRVVRDGEPVERRASFDVRDKRVIILGGGDTGSDCLGTAIRQGARDVIQVELMARPPSDRVEGNPWPTWPLVFRTSSSQQEGGTREFAFRTTRLEGTGGKLTALVGERVDGEPGEVRFEVDQVILALGFVGADASSLVDQLGVTLDARGTIAVDRDKRTNVARVYAAGDAHLGASLVVWAIAEGRDVAMAVDADLARAPATTAS